MTKGTVADLCFQENKRRDPETLDDSAVCCNC
jgi:hypothetical protein